MLAPFKAIKYLQKQRKGQSNLEKSMEMRPYLKIIKI